MRATGGDILPAGSGRFFVLSIRRSISLSIQQLITQAPATKPDVPAIEIRVVRVETSPGARNKPRALVKITSAESLGFVSERKSKNTETFFSPTTSTATEGAVIIIAHNN
jgi:hypothetical protein